MPSPFPGMDPYLEAHWADVHTSLTTYARNQLQPQLPDDLSATVEECVHLSADDGSHEARVRPDVQVRGSSTDPASAQSTASLAAVTSVPILVPVAVPWTERWVEIRETGSGHLVTAIEFLSPGNKQTSRQRDLFRDKQEMMTEAGVNVVEIDLIVGGKWAISAPEDVTPDECAYPYRICVLRANHPSQAECYPTPLSQSLPRLAIPLRPGDADVVLDLQPLLSAAWTDGNYRRIDYVTARRPRFRREDELWIDEALAQWKASRG